MPNQSSVYSIVGVDGVFGTGTGDVPVSSTDEGVSGSLSNTPVPQNTAWLVQKRSALGGRSNRGRMYVPGIPEDQIDPAGRIVGAHLANLNLAIISFQEDLEAITTVGELVIFHDDPGELPTQISQLIVDPVVATQRRRLRR